MSERTEDDDFALERDIAREITEAFADVPYPGDDNLLAYPDHYESDRIFEAFHSKHWREITPELLFSWRADLHLLAPTAYHFYLPCFMIGALLHTEETDTLWQSVFFDLTPPQSEGPRMDWFRALVDLLDARQKAAVRRYVELYVQTETTFPDPDNQRALAFWRQITDPHLIADSR